MPNANAIRYARRYTPKRFHVRYADKLNDSDGQKIVGML